MKMKNLLWGVILILLGSGCAIDNTPDYSDLKPIAKMVKEAQSEVSSTQVITLLQPTETVTDIISANKNADTIAKRVSYFQPNIIGIKNTLSIKSNYITTYFDIDDTTSIKLDLVKVNPFTDDYESYYSNNSLIKKEAVGLHYWGIADDDINSLVSVSIFPNNQVEGIISFNNERGTYNFGKKSVNTTDNTHVIYNDKDITLTHEFICKAIDEETQQNQIKNVDEIVLQNENNCVRQYAEINNGLYVQLTNAGINPETWAETFYSQIAAMYAQEEIVYKLHELKIWNTPDPYFVSGGTYLNSFKDILGINYDGDLAQLLAPMQGYGIAYLNQLCNKLYAKSVVTVTITYPQLPLYSWNIIAATHEVGHNLGSPHTHTCAWNGPNGYLYPGGTAIDGCGVSAGYSEGCTAPLPPPGGGTVMSYCHILPSVGTTPSNGFGLQPGNRIRDRVYNASCLSTCAAPPPTNVVDAGISKISTPIASPCVTPIAPVVNLKNYGTIILTSADIEYFTDAEPASTYAWSGSLAAGDSTQITLSSIDLLPGNHSFTARSKNPNGEADDNPTNDSKTKTYLYDTLACNCNNVVIPFPNTPLTRFAGTGSVSTSLTFTEETKNLIFTISNLGSNNTGPNSKRYAERVIVTYVNGANITKQYGIFNGSIQSTVKVKIPSIVKSVTVKLDNGYSSSYNGNLSVNLSSVNLCEVQ